MQLYKDRANYLYITDQTVATLIRQAPKRPVNTLERLQEITALLAESIDGTTVSSAIQQSVLYGIVVRISHCL